MHEMFRSADLFNQDISGWNTSKITSSSGMSGMFQDADEFNQDISTWCVSSIATKPTNFDLRAGFAGTPAIQPQWGTCP